jgi:hypothetical protein
MGWSRAARQEGTAGNGFEFLMMHRAMLEILREAFPHYSIWFMGWSTPPTDPSHPDDPSPRGSSDTFAPDMRLAVDRVTNQLGTFASEDVLGLYVETRLQPLPGKPQHLNPDVTSGIHGYLHNRFSVANSDIDMGQPLRNLSNARFWRLHAWIDNRWTTHRRQAGISDADRTYRAALDALKQHLRSLGDHVHHPMMMALAAPAGVSPRVLPVLPLSALHPFRPTTARRLAQLMETSPVIQTREELFAYLQLAIQIEHGTLPLYLTAMWSIKDQDKFNAAYEIIHGIAFQEMLHMGTICNLLRAIADPMKAEEMPQISRPLGAIPTFPGPMPGLDLTDSGITDVYLEPLYSTSGDHKDRVRLFMRIEKPNHPIAQLLAAVNIPRFKTIGEFYDVILKGLDNLAAGGSITFDSQASGQLEKQIDVDRLRKIRSLADAKDAINLIKEQGEGMIDSQAPDPAANDVAHFFRFNELLVEQKYDKDAQGRWVLNPNVKVPFPTADDIFPMAPVPVQGYPDSVVFDRVYSEMLDLLQEAWDNGDAAKLMASVGRMKAMGTLAQDLMGKNVPAGAGTLGPDFHYVPIDQRKPDRGSSTGGTVTAPLVGYVRIKEILDQAVQGENIGAHGAFWRTLTRDQFVAKIVRGLKLIATRADNTFDPDESNLVKALEGRAPFGADLPAPPAGAIFSRMPDGFPPVPADRIGEIRAWIGASCPDTVVPAATLLSQPLGAQPSSPAIHVEFWRDFDNWAAFNAGDQTQADIDAFFAIAPKWMALAKDGSTEAAWVQALADPPSRAAVLRLEALQRETVIRHYGQPVPLPTLLDGFERFGNDSLPADPLRPDDPRHRMNGKIMWFFWSAFADACFRLSGSTSAPIEFWRAMTRCILVGLINDGVFRGRFAVAGIPATAEGKQMARDYATALDAAKLQHELQRRYLESGL